MFSHVLLLQLTAIWLLAGYRAAPGFPSRARGIAFGIGIRVSVRIVVCPPRSLSVSQQFLKVTAVPACAAASSLPSSPLPPPPVSPFPRFSVAAVQPSTRHRKSPSLPRPCGIPLETFRYSYLPATTSKIPSSPPLGPREFSLSYKGFAATYNISPPPFPCHFALSASTLSNLPRPSPPSARRSLPFRSRPLPVRRHRRSKGPLRPFFGVRPPTRICPLRRRSHGHPSRRVFCADPD